jgi:uncharacterized membrane protein (UPF0127 family)
MKPLTRLNRRGGSRHLSLHSWLITVSLLSAAAMSSGAEITVTVNAIPFQVEIAQTPSERQRGLMFRTHLADHRGMLFIQPEAGPAAFWMKNTLIALDILYFDSEGKLLALYPNVPPCMSPQCPVYASKGAVKYILELKGGSTERLGIETGARLHLD